MHEGVVILIPAFNDWDALALLLPELDSVLARNQIYPDVVIVDDGSTILRPSGFPTCQLSAIGGVRVLQTRRNLGHQRALAVGMVYIHEHIPCRRVVVMDADGEDRPHDIPALLARCEQDSPPQIVFAARLKRVESAAFRFFYQLYRLAHWLLVGVRVRVGNFSVIPRESLSRLVVMGEIWNHYAAAVFRGRLPFTTIALERGRRLAGQSKMNFISLATHGLSAISVFADVVGVRLFTAAIALMSLSTALFAGLAVARFGFEAPVPVWMLYGAAFVSVILLQAVMFAFVLAATMLGSRINAGFVPLRDCPFYVQGVERVFPADD